MKKYWLLLIPLVILGGMLAYYLISPAFIVVELNEEMTAEGQEVEILHETPFQERAHEVKGTLKVFKENGKTILRFENFESINGPNLHVWLSKDLEATDYLDLGPLKGTKGSFNYELPEGVDIKEYKYVLIWCVPFKVLFSFAQLML